MSILKYLAMGAAIAFGVNYVTKKRPDGKSIVDDITEKAPEWMEKAKPYIARIKEEFEQVKAKGTRY